MTAVWIIVGVVVFGLIVLAVRRGLNRLISGNRWEGG